MLTAGVDVGGTNIGAGLVREDHEVVARAKRATPDAADDVVDVIVELIDALDGEVAAVGVGFPGVIHEGTVLGAPNLAGWSGDLDLAGRLEERTGRPVALGNDANVALMGEWLAGAAAGHDDVLGVWMGTGIGGGLVLDGRPYRGARGGAGELGHVVVRQAGTLCACGRRGCVEAYAGRRSMETAVAARVEAGGATSLYDIQKKAGKAEMTSKVWHRALEQGDALATEVFDDALDALGTGIGSVVNMLDLERIVIGGGLAEKMGQDLADRIAEASLPWMLHPPPALRFVAAELGDDSGLVGAASLGRALIVGG